MLRQLRPRSIYDVMAAIGCFAALATGTAYAANTVFSTDIVDGEVKSVDIGNGEVNSADVKDQSLTTFDVSTFLGADVVDNTLTGADVNESTLNLAAEPWHEVGSAGQPPFTGGSLFLCDWTNFNDSFNSAAFLRDRFGIVHLKGMVASHIPASGHICGTAIEDSVIFTLPAGYRPARNEVHPTLTNNALGRIDVDPPGPVSIDVPATFNNTGQWISLDGISFRCAPSGQNGCP